MTDTQEIQWGPAIAVDGKRPGWLCSGEWRRVRSLAVGEWQTADVESPGDTIPDMEEWNWGDITAIRLPADHPHYRQPAPIDWSGELEAVHEDGRVVPVTLAPDEHGYGGSVPRVTNECPAEDTNNNWYEDGSDFCHDGKWRIRNVTPQPTPQADTKPDVTARMEALVRRMAGEPGRQLIAASDGDYAEARAIVALLPEPVDPDLIEARAMAKKLASDTDSRWGSERHCNKYDSGELDDNLMAGVSLAYDAIKRGRELALTGEAGK